MNKGELIEMLATENDMSVSQSRRYFESLLELIEKRIKKGEDVNITGFGKFEVVKRAGRKGRNPASGESLAAVHRPDEGSPRRPFFMLGPGPAAVDVMACRSPRSAMRSGERLVYTQPGRRASGTASVGRWPRRCGPHCRSSPPSRDAGPRLCI